jgi:hypothetical protein
MISQRTSAIVTTLVVAGAVILAVMLFLAGAMWRARVTP